MKTRSRLPDSITSVKEYSRGFAFILLIAVVGSVVIFASKAATTTSNSEAESGTLSGGAAQISDSSASSGKAIKFSNGNDASGGCPPYPAFPDASCTGWQHTGVKLTPYTGPYVITTPGTVIDGKDIAKAISIRASNVTIRRSRIRVPGPQGNRYCFNDNIVNVMNASCDYVNYSNIVLEDVEVDGMGYSGRGEIADGGNNGAVAIDGQGITCIRCNIHSTGLGMRTGDDGTPGGLIDSYIHDIIDGNVPGAHNDGLLSNGGSNVTIEHNNIEVDNGQTAPIALYGDFAPIKNFLIEKNLFNGGGFCVYGGSLPSKAYPIGTDIRFVDNHFGRKFFNKCGYWGPVAYFNPNYSGNVWSGNVWEDTGTSVPYLIGQ